jgi:hypothetical protein
MQTIHLEWMGKSTRVTLESLPKKDLKLTPVSKTALGTVRTVRIVNGKKNRAEKMNLTASQIIDGDPELNYGAAGEVLTAEMVSAAYYDPEQEEPVPIAGFKMIDHVFDPLGQEKETRPTVIRHPNINELHPIKVGKRMALDQALLQFVFKETRQIIHVDGLSYDFLFSLAKELHTKRELAILGAGAKGNQPIVMKEKGTPIRAFLFGEVGSGDEADRYRLLLLLSDQELKMPAHRAASAEAIE